MAFPFLLLAAQAAGIGLSIAGTNSANRFNRFGTSLDQQSIDLTMQQEQLASTQQSLQSTENLREVLASQRSLMAARGQMSGVGSAKALEQGSIRAFNSDEYARNLSMIFREGQLKRDKRMLEASYLGKKSKNAGKLTRTIFNQINFNAMQSDLGSLLGDKSKNKQSNQSKTQSNKKILNR